MLSVLLSSRGWRTGWPHAGFWHLFAEVEAVFGVWAFALIRHGGVVRAARGHRVHGDAPSPSRLVFVIMVVAASRPILELVGQLVARARVCRAASRYAS